MKRLNFIPATIILSTLLISCAETPKKVSGSITRKISDQEAAVDLGKDKVNVGDQVAVVEKVCESKPRSKGSLISCKENKLGQGEITAVRNRSSIVRFNSDTDFEEGDTLVKAIR